MTKMKTPILQKLEISDDAEIQLLKENFQYYICDKTCPCCDRLCGEEDSVHMHHKVKYGHQIRGMGGSKYGNDEASVKRCENLDDQDLIDFNGKEQSWLEFKLYMSQTSNTKWLYDDLDTTKKDQDLESQFQYAWSIAGPRICTEKFKNTIKYVEYNKANLMYQSKPSSDPRIYIFIIDSSGSMRSEWENVKNSVKRCLGEISRQNNKHLAAIINFSSSAQIEYSVTKPNNINPNSLQFQGRDTNFEAALSTANQIMKSDKEKRYSIIFLTDGAPTSDPKKSLAEMKIIAKSLSSSHFEFFGIGFKSQLSELDRITSELDGKSKFACDANSLTTTMKEIINKQL